MGILKTIDIDKATGVSVSIIPEVAPYPNDTRCLKPQYSLPDDSIAWAKWERWSISPAMIVSISFIQLMVNNFILSLSQPKMVVQGPMKLKIIVNKRNVWIPNTFTVNGDQLNDCFFFPLLPMVPSNKLNS
ncbi:MAG: hypothetical protein IPL98_15495 [Saprospiraceae bacterium]|nr:hypothetical protein [Saprospiraceae bacterium]